MIGRTPKAAQSSGPQSAKDGVRDEGKSEGAKERGARGSWGTQTRTETETETKGKTDTGRHRGIDTYLC